MWCISWDFVLFLVSPRKVPQRNFKPCGRSMNDSKSFVTSEPYSHAGMSQSILKERWRYRVKTKMPRYCQLPPFSFTHPCVSLPHFYPFFFAPSPHLTLSVSLRQVSSLLTLGKFFSLNRPSLWGIRRENFSPRNLSPHAPLSKVI